MKYIRMKDGIIVDTTKYKNVVERTFNGKVVAIDLNHWGQDNDKYPTFIEIKDIINQADTIEELCDRFVMFCPNAVRRKIRVYDTMSSISLYFKRDKRWNGNMVDKVYGAIWTDKGLIYVAKMNEQGELELL